jgi:molecular chaperone GrpE (heat shock protein)
MVNKTISISDFLFEKLKEESNASGLIERLLRKHYELKPLKEEKEEKEEELKKQAIERKARKFAEVKDNFFITHPEANDENFVEFMDNCSDTLRIKCGLDIKTKKILEDENAINDPMP